MVSHYWMLSQMARDVFCTAVAPQHSIGADKLAAVRGRARVNGGSHVYSTAWLFLGMYKLAQVQGDPQTIGQSTWGGGE